LADLSNWVGQLNANSVTRAAMLIAISEGSEHILIGNDHLVSNNTTTGSSTFTLDHTTDKQAAGDIVRRLYTVALGRDADPAVLATYSAAILNGTDTEPQLASILIGSSEFASRYGSLTNTAFVSQMFQNALGRAPTSSESSFWTSALNAGTVTRADLVTGL